MKQQDTRNNSIKSWDTPPFALTAGDTAAILGTSRESIYDMFAVGAIPTIIVGKRKRVPREALRCWMGE